MTVTVGTLIAGAFCTLEITAGVITEEMLVARDTVVVATAAGARGAMVVTVLVLDSRSVDEHDARDLAVALASVLILGRETVGMLSNAVLAIAVCVFVGIVTGGHVTLADVAIVVGTFVIVTGGDETLADVAIVLGTFVIDTGGHGTLADVAIVVGTFVIVTGGHGTLADVAIVVGTFVTVTGGHGTLADVAIVVGAFVIVTDGDDTLVDVALVTRDISGFTEPSVVVASETWQTVAGIFITKEFNFV
jgi:hypothetical protein